MVDKASRPTPAKLAPRDAEFIYNENPGHAGHLIVTYFFDIGDRADVTREQAVQWVTDRLGLAQLFTNRLHRVPLDLDFPRWIPVSVDVNQHVTVEEASGPGWEPARRSLGDLLARRLDLARPPWEIHVLNGVRELDDLDGRFTLVTLKIHHSAADGLTTRDLSRAMFSAPAAGAEPVLVRKPAEVQLAGRALVTAPAHIYRFFRGLATTKRAAAEVVAAEAAGEIAAVREDRRPTRFNRGLSGDISVDFIMLSTSEVKAIKEAVPGASVNDVYLTIVAGGLMRYLDHQGEKPPDSLCAMAPRSMRKIMEWESANQLAILTVDLHTDEVDPVVRLRKIVASTREAKKRSEHPAVRASARRVETSPALMLRLTGFAVRHYPHDSDRGRRSHTTVSNIPLSVNDCSFHGAPAVAILGGQPPTAGDALRHYLLSAGDDRLVLNFFSSTAAMPFPALYAGFLRDSFAELVEAAGMNGLSKEI